MIVARNTPDQLILSHKPIWITIFLLFWMAGFVGVGTLVALNGQVMGWFFIVMGLGMGGLFLVVFVRRSQVILDRPKAQLIMRSKTLLNYTEVIHDLPDLSHAELQTTHGKNGTMYRPVLVLNKGMSAGVHPIVSYYTNGKAPDHMVRAVNDWLALSS